MLNLTAVKRGTPVLQARLDGPYGPLVKSHEVDEFAQRNTATSLLIVKPDEGGGWVGEATLTMDPLVVYPDRAERNLIAVLTCNSPTTSFDGGETEIDVRASEFTLNPDGTGSYTYNIRMAEVHGPPCITVRFWQPGSEPKMVSFPGYANGYVYEFVVHERICHQRDTRTAVEPGGVATKPLVDLEGRAVPDPEPRYSHAFRTWLYKADATSIVTPVGEFTVEYNMRKWQQIEGYLGQVGKMGVQPHVPAVSEKYNPVEHFPEVTEDYPHIALAAASGGLPAGVYNLVVESKHEEGRRVEFQGALTVRCSVTFSKTEVRPGIPDNRSESVTITLPEGAEATFASSNAERAAVSPASSGGATSVQVTVDGLVESDDDQDTQLVVSLDGEQCSIPVTVVRPADYRSEKKDSKTFAPGERPCLVDITIEILDQFTHVLGSNWNGLKVQEWVWTQGKEPGNPRWVGFGRGGVGFAPLVEGSIIDPTGVFMGGTNVGHKQQRIRVVEDDGTDIVFPAINDRTITSTNEQGTVTVIIENSH